MVSYLPVKTEVKCLRHQLKPTNRYCALCEAKRQGNGKPEAARRIYVNGKK